MPRPIVIAYQLIWTCYGWWLPNDLRGSGSRAIASDILARLGEVHFGRKKIQPASADIRRFYEEAAQLLKYPLLTLGSDAIRAVGEAFAEVIERAKYTCYACAIMPDHVHILIRKHKHLAEEMMERLKAASRERLVAMGLRETDHPVWTGGGGWKVFLDHPDEVWRTIPYIDENPTKIRLPRQVWPFVRAYDDWPLHAGHSPNSPYARRLRGEC
jgi:REP element-mobilizing transposase RayT